MNRRDFIQAVDKMLAASAADGRPWVLAGLTDACVDCDSEATIYGQPGSPLMWADIRHDDSCPAFNGVTRWRIA